MKVAEWGRHTNTSFLRQAGSSQLSEPLFVNFDKAAKLKSWHFLHPSERSFPLLVPGPESGMDLGTQVVPTHVDRPVKAHLIYLPKRGALKFGSRKICFHNNFTLEFGYPSFQSAGFEARLFIRLSGPCHWNLGAVIAIPLSVGKTTGHQ